MREPLLKRFYLAEPQRQNQGFYRLAGISKPVEKRSKPREASWIRAIEQEAPFERWARLRHGLRALGRWRFGSK